MELTPEIFPHMIKPLLALGSGKVAVILENCESTFSEPAALTLRTLIGDPCPSLVETLDMPCDDVCQSIKNCIEVHLKNWKSLQSIGCESYKNLTLDLTLSSSHSILSKQDNETKLIMMSEKLAWFKIGKI